MSSKPAVAISNLIALIQRLLGIFLLFIFGICTISYIFDKEYRSENGIDFLIFCLIFLLIGFVLVRSSAKRKKLAREFKKYVSVISTEPTDSIARIADVTGKTMEEVTKNLELMLKRNFFVNAHINYAEKSIVFGSGPGQNFGMTQMPQIEYVSFSCKYCCGVSEGIKGQPQKCKYCGMILK